MTTQEKKLPSITWEQIIMEAMLALTAGRPDIDVPSEAIYQWIEATEYLTEWGRASDPAWSDGKYPSYRASLQLRWQRMVKSNTLVRTEVGVYRLAKDATLPNNSVWNQMLQIDEDLSDPKIRSTIVKRIQRSQGLRDRLANYYQCHCQICDVGSSYLIPTEITGRYYVEVHHVKGLAEATALKQEGLLVGLRVNGLSNLTVLCPHHHALIHHHWPRYDFDRKNLLWRHSGGGTLQLGHLTSEHAQLLKTG